MHLAIKMQILWLYTVFKKCFVTYQKMYKSLFSTRLTVGRIQELLSQTKAASLQREHHTAAAGFSPHALSCFLHYLD